MSIMSSGVLTTSIVSAWNIVGLWNQKIGLIKNCWRRALNIYMYIQAKRAYILRINHIS